MFLESRASENEQKRLNSILSLIPQKGISVLDVGARDGYHISKLTEKFDHITALDLQKPNIKNDKVSCVSGDIRQLPFQDNSFELVICAEVLEHIPTIDLKKACEELERVAEKELFIGVPYLQDIRLGRTICKKCGGKNPPWGHINNFSKGKLLNFFPNLKVKKIEYVGNGSKNTNFISVLLRDFAGNPFGSYSQEEKCIFCNSEIIRPERVSFLSIALCKLASLLDKIQNKFVKKDGNWVHILFKKEEL